MTSTVVVNAHCGPDKEVLIELIDAKRYHSYQTEDILVKTVCIQDGETYSECVYDALYVTVREVTK